MNRISCTQFFRSVAASGTMWLALAALPLVASCGKYSDPSSRDMADMPSVTVSIEPLGYFAGAIGGDSLDVHVLLPKGSDPETFEPSTSVMRALAGSSALIMTGTLPFEKTLSDNIAANNAGLRIFSSGKGIEPIFGTHSHHSGGEDHSHSHGDEPDPHIWSSVKNARVIAGNILQALLEVAPEHAGYYTARHAELAARLDSLDRAFTEALAPLPSRAFVVWHPSLSYFARDYSLHQIALNAENKETSPLRAGRILSAAAAEHPAALFIPEGLRNGQVESAARELNLNPVAVNLMSADWIADMKKVADTLSATANTNSR